MMNIELWWLLILDEIYFEIEASSLREINAKLSFKMSAISS